MLFLKCNLTVLSLLADLTEFRCFLKVILNAVKCGISTIVIITPDNTANYTYDAYGNQITDTADSNPFRYCGEYYDNETGFIYLRNRYYDPSIGRFTTEDPVKDGDNWYVYCGNNPVNAIDPFVYIS